MKGQYLAVESVLTFGLGLMAAVGIISVFDSYSTGIYDTSESVEAKIIQERILDNTNTLRPVKGEAYRDIDLPDKIANRDYQVVGGNTLAVNVDGKEYSASLPAEDVFQGSGSGEIRLHKTSNGFEIVDR